MSLVSSCIFFDGERSKPDLPRMAQRRADEKMVLAAPAPFGAQQARLLKHRQVPRKPLPGDARLLPGDEPNVQLEQGLSVALGELIKQPPPRGVRQRVEYPIKLHAGCIDRDGAS